MKPSIGEGSSIRPGSWTECATGIEPVTPSMSTRCLKPNTLSLFGFPKTFVVFFAVCSRRIIAVRCRERVSFSGDHSTDAGHAKQYGAGVH